MIYNILVNSSITKHPNLMPSEKTRLLSGALKTRHDRFYANPSQVFVLKRARDEALFPCVSAGTLSLWLSKNLSRNERARISQVRAERVACTKIGEDIFSLVGADMTKIQESQKRYASLYAKAARYTYYHKYKEKNKARKTKWSRANREHIRAYERGYVKQRRREDPNFKMRGNLRTRIHLAIKANNKSAGLYALLACSITELKTHLQRQFTKGMNWDNYGQYWVIDHIIPCCSFDLSKPEEQRRCFHFSNLQPLTHLENTKKGSRIIPPTVTLEPL